MLTVEKIDSTHSLCGIRSDWEGLLAASPHRMPFLSHGWIMTWWKHFGAGKQLCVLVVRDGGRPVLIAPLMRYPGRLHRRYVPLPVELIETIANTHSNRVDFIYAVPQERYFRAVWDYLLGQERQWHLLRCHPVLEQSSTLATVRPLIESAGIPAVFTLSQTSPYVPITGTWKEYETSLSPKLRANLRRAARGLKADFEIINDASGLEAALAEVFEISSKGWAAKNGTALCSTPQLRQFYTDLAYLAAEKGWIFLCILRIDGKPAAYEYNLRSADTVYNLKIAYDEEYSRHRPGQILKRFVLSEIFQNIPDIREYDFLGDSDTYKFDWTPERRRHVKTHIFHPASVWARIAHLVESALLEYPSVKHKLVWRPQEQ